MSELPTLEQQLEAHKRMLGMMQEQMRIEWERANQRTRERDEARQVAAYWYQQCLEARAVCDELADFNIAKWDLIIRMRRAIAKLEHDLYYGNGHDRD